MLRDSTVAAVVVRTRPREIPLASITWENQFMGFFSYLYGYGAPLSEVAPSISPLTFMLLLCPYTFPPLHTLFSFIPADHEIAHQWSGNPHSWDSIYQPERKPQRLLVKLLTNKFNTKWFPRLSFRETQIQNDRWLSRFQIYPVECGR